LAYDKNLISFFRFEDIRTPERGSPLPSAGPPFPFNSQFGWRSSLPSRAEAKFVKFRFYPRSRGNYFSFSSKGRLLNKDFLKNFIDFTFPLCIINVVGSVWQYYERKLEMYLINRSGLTVKLVDVACSFLQQYFALIGKNNFKKYLINKVESSYFRYEDISRLVKRVARRLYGR